MKQLFWVVVKLHKHRARISAQSLEIKGVSLSHVADFRVCRRPEREEQKRTKPEEGGRQERPESDVGGSLEESCGLHFVVTPVKRQQLCWECGSRRAGRGPAHLHGTWGGRRDSNSQPLLGLTQTQWPIKDGTQRKRSAKEERLALNQQPPPSHTCHTPAPLP